MEVTAAPWAMVAGEASGDLLASLLLAACASAGQGFAPRVSAVR